MDQLPRLAASAACLFASTLLSQVPGREVVSGNSSMQLSVETEGSSGNDPEGRLRADANQWSQTLGAIKPGTQPQTKPGKDGLASVWSVQFSNEPKFLHLFMTLDRSSSICHVRAPAGVKTMFTIQGTIQRCMAELKAATPNATATATSPAAGAATQGPAAGPQGTATSTSTQQAASYATPRPTAAARPPRPGAPPKPVSAEAPPAHPENWNNVAEVLFRTAYTAGYGGMMTVQYEPLVMFRDGTYFEAYDAALEDLDLQQERQLRPVHFGTWRAQGVTYFLTDNRGRPHDYKLQDGNLFRAFPAEAGGPLQMRYKSVTGGGNSAVGGDVGILVTSQMTFAADGRFASGQDVGILGSGNTSGVSMAGGAKKRSGVGSYKVQKHTIELRYPDGRSERRFFAYSSAHTPAQVDREMVFLGDTPYAHDK